MGEKVNRFLNRIKDRKINRPRPENGREAFAKAYTTVLFRKLQECNNDEEYFRVLDPERKGYDDSLDSKWCIEYVNNLVGNFIISERRLSQLCDVSLNKVKSWSEHAPRKREDYVAISCVFGLGVEKCSRIMQRYGGYFALSEDKPDDIVWIRLLQLSERDEDDFENQEKQRIYVDYRVKYEDIRRLIDSRKRENISAAAERLYGMGDGVFLDMYRAAQEACEPSARMLNQKITDCFSAMGYSKDMFFKEKKLHAGYSKAMSRLSAQDIIPDRNILISLFLHMGLPVGKINGLLSIAGMEQLCAQNPYESALIYVLSVLCKEFPQFGDESVMLSPQNREMQKKLESGSVYMYVYKRLQQPKFVKKFEQDEVDLEKCICLHLRESN